MAIQKELVWLCSQIPWPPNEKPPEGITDKQLREFEIRTGIRIPECLKEWLKYINGALIGPGGVLGIVPGHRYLDIEFVWQGYPEWKNRGWIPVAGDGCGNFYVLVLGQPTYPICFVDTAWNFDRLAYVVASDLWHFLRFLFREELGETAWPFCTDKVLSDDPDLADCVCAPLPWNADE